MLPLRVIAVVLSALSAPALAGCATEAGSASSVATVTETVTATAPAAPPITETVAVDEALIRLEEWWANLEPSIHDELCESFRNENLGPDFGSEFGVEKTHDFMNSKCY